MLYNLGVYLISKHSDRTCRGHFRRAKPYCCQAGRQVQYENLRTSCNRLTQHGHIKSVRTGRRDFKPGTDHRAARAGYHSHAKTLFKYIIWT